MTIHDTFYDTASHTIIRGIMYDNLADAVKTVVIEVAVAALFRSSKAPRDMINPEDELSYFKHGEIDFAIEVGLLSKFL